MTKKLIVLTLLALLDFCFVRYILAAELQQAEFAIVVIYLYCVLANFIIAGLLTRIKLGDYSGVFIVNAFLLT